MAKRRKREKDEITKFKESLVKKLHMNRDKKILVGTPMYHGLRPLMPMFVRYLNYETQNYKNLKWFWVLNYTVPKSKDPSPVRFTGPWNLSNDSPFFTPTRTSGVSAPESTVTKTQVVELRPFLSVTVRNAVNTPFCL